MHKKSKETHTLSHLCFVCKFCNGVSLSCSEIGTWNLSASSFQTSGNRCLDIYALFKLYLWLQQFKMYNIINIQFQKSLLHPVYHIFLNILLFYAMHLKKWMCSLNVHICLYCTHACILVQDSTICCKKDSFPHIIPWSSSFVIISLTKHR